MSVRVFVSVRAPDTPAMASLRADAEAAGARASPPGQTHVTLRFIGDVPESKVAVVEACVKRAAAGTGPFELTLSGAGAFPNERRPSVVWVGAGPADVLAGLSDRLASELRGAGVPFDGKPFKAHVTVARCRDGLTDPSLFDRYRGTEFARCECSEVLVMKSVLGPGGAKHTVLARVPLARVLTSRLLCATLPRRAPFITPLGETVPRTMKTNGSPTSGSIEGLPLQLMIIILVATMGTAIIVGWMGTIETPHAIGGIDAPATIAAHGNELDDFSITVTDQDGNLLEGATVILEGLNAKIDGATAYAVTGSDGVASFSGVTVTKTGGATMGYISLNVSKPGYTENNSYKIVVVL